MRNFLCETLSISKQNGWNNSVNFIFSTNGPRDMGTSGGAVRELELMKRIGAHQNIVLWVISSKTVCDRFQRNGVRAHYQIIPDLLKHENFGSRLLDSFVRSISSSLLTINICSDNIVFHSPSDFLWDTYPAFIRKIRNKRMKWFASVYHVVPHPSKRPGGMHLSNLFSFVAQRESLLLMAKNADIIQTETNYVRDELVRQFGFSPEKIFVCQSGINPKVIDAFSWNGDKIYDACFLARLHKSKGVFDIINTWRRVCESKKDARLAIAGYGSSEIVNELKKRIKVLHLEKNVFYLGCLTEERKYRLYRSSKLYVLPSYEEGIPITFYEAMYCGLTVVTYYLPTYSDIKNYVVGVPLGDIAALGEAIMRILNDAELLRTFGEKGHDFAEGHTWEKVAETILSNVVK